MKRIILAVTLTFCLAAGSAAWAYLQLAGSGTAMSEAAARYLSTLDEGQRAKSLLAYEAPERLDWHFIPKDQRKGLQIKEMTEPQREAALALLKSALSQIGYDKATKIMKLEEVLLELESSKQGTPLRDPQRYYFTVFGNPEGSGRWGLSVEGHHLSLNFVVEGEQVVSAAPAVFCTNPAIVKTETSTGVPVGTRVLADEELLAFELLKSLTAEQRSVAIIDATAPREIRAAGEPQPPQTEPAGLAAEKMTNEQVNLLRKLVETYANNARPDVAEARMGAIRRAGPGTVHFAWAGAEEPGVGHYYRIQGPTFLIELVNTQPDAAGNPANHVHSIWRDMQGDFGIPVAK